MSTLGLYRENFVGKYIERVKSFECNNCQLVSPKNYFIECGHCICQTCITDFKNCINCEEQAIRIHGDNPTAFQFISTEAIINPYLVKCIFDPCKWEGTYHHFINKHYHECEYKGNKKLSDEYFEKFVEEVPIKINRNFKNKNKINNRKRFRYNSFDKNDKQYDLDEKSFNSDNNLHQKSNYFLNEKKNFNLIDSDDDIKFFSDSNLICRLPRKIPLKNSSEEKRHNSEESENEEKNDENKDIIEIYDDEEDEEQNNRKDIMNIYRKDKYESSENDEDESFRIDKKKKKQNHWKNYNKNEFQFLERKRKKEDTIIISDSENDIKNDQNYLDAVNYLKLIFKKE